MKQKSKTIPVTESVIQTVICPKCEGKGMVNHHPLQTKEHIHICNACGGGKTLLHISVDGYLMMDDLSFDQMKYPNTHIKTSIVVKYKNEKV